MEFAVVSYTKVDNLMTKIGLETNCYWLDTEECLHMTDSIESLFIHQYLLQKTKIIAEINTIIVKNDLSIIDKLHKANEELIAENSYSIEYDVEELTNVINNINTVDGDDYVNFELTFKPLNNKIIIFSEK